MVVSLFSYIFIGGNKVMSAEGKKGTFDWYFKSNLLIRILIGLILGAIVGLIFGESIIWISPLGDLFVRLLKMIVMPVIFTTLVVGAASISPAELGKVGIKIVLFYLLTSAFAIAVGLIMANIFKPGLGLELTSASGAAGKAVEQPALQDTLLNIVPTNPFAAIVNGDVLPTIFFAIVFGISMSYLKISGNERLKSAGDTLYKIFDGAAEVMFIVVRGVLQYATDHNKHNLGGAVKNLVQCVTGGFKAFISADFEVTHTDTKDDGEEDSRQYIAVYNRREGVGRHDIQQGILQSRLFYRLTCSTAG